MGCPSTGTSRSARSCTRAAPSCGRIWHSHTLESRQKLTTHTQKHQRGQMFGFFFLTVSVNLTFPHGFLPGLYFILTLTPSLGYYLPFFLHFHEWETYLWQTWSGHSRSGPFLRSGRSPHGRQGWKCQNLMKERVSDGWLRCNSSIITNMIFKSSITRSLGYGK